MTNSQNKTNWRAQLIDHRVHQIDHAGAPYVLGRWHHGRASLRGYHREILVNVKALFTPEKIPHKFLIVALPRSGTTLLKRLISQVPGIHCDTEMLNHAVAFPHRYLNRLARTRGLQVYGSKVLSYQLLEVQSMKNSAADFFEGLVDDGYTLIHLRRNIFDQVLSLSTARATQAYHVKTDQNQEVSEVTLDPDAFAAQLRRSEVLLDYEDLLFSELPHVRLQYEEDLVSPILHQKTVDRICARLGIPSGPVEADLKRTSKQTIITNLEQLRAQSALGASEHSPAL